MVPISKSAGNKKSSTPARQRQSGEYGRGQGRLQKKDECVRRNMKIEVHSGMHEKPQAGNQRARMIGKVPRIAFYVENFPCRPKKQDQEDKAAKAADRARFGQGLRIIVMAVIYDETIIGRFVEWKDFLQGAQACSQDSVIPKDP